MNPSDSSSCDLLLDDNDSNTCIVSMQVQMDGAYQPMGWPPEFEQSRIQNPIQWSEVTDYLTTKLQQPDHPAKAALPRPVAVEEVRVGPRRKKGCSSRSSRMQRITLANSIEERRQYNLIGISVLTGARKKPRGPQGPR
jgi:hypothetical protein